MKAHQPQGRTRAGSHPRRGEPVRDAVARHRASRQDFRSDFSACGGAAYCWGAGAGAPPNHPSPTPPRTRRPPSSHSRVGGFVHPTRSGHHDRHCQRNQACDLKRLRASSADEKAGSVPLVQDVTRAHPPRRDDVGPISAVVAAGRRSAFRAGIDVSMQSSTTTSAASPASSSAPTTGCSTTSRARWGRDLGL